MQKAMMEENRLIAKEKKDADIRDAAIAAKLEQANIEAAMNDPFLNEHFDKTKSSVAAHRFVPAYFKGLREDQIKSIQHEQEQQVQEAEMKQKQKEEEDRLWGLQQEHLRKLKIKQDRELKKGIRDVAKAQSEFNLQKKGEDDYMKW